MFIIYFLLYRKSDATFEQQRYKFLLKCLDSIISEKNNIEGNALPSSIDTTQSLQSYFKEDKQVLDMFLTADSIYRQLLEIGTQDINDGIKIKIKMLTAQLSLLTSLIFVRIMAEISAIDHVEKYRLKVQYIEEDVHMFDKLLSVYYMYGIISGTISEQRNVEKVLDVTSDWYKEGSENREKLKKVHPYCPILMDLKEKTAQMVHKYASGNTFRSKEPSYNNFVKVSFDRSTK